MWVCDPLLNWNFPAIAPIPIIVPLIATGFFTICTVGSFALGTGVKQPQLVYFGENIPKLRETDESDASARIIDSTAPFSSALNHISFANQHELVVYASPQKYDPEETLFTVCTEKEDFIPILSGSAETEMVDYCDCCSETKKIVDMPWYVHINLFWKFHTIEKVTLCQDCTEQICEQVIVDEQSPINTEDLVAYKI